MKKVLIITYYWPPSGGSGVQRWMYFAKYLLSFGIEPIILTVSERYASYKNLEPKFLEHVKGIKTYKTKSLEPAKLYSWITTGSTTKGIPQGKIESGEKGVIHGISNFVRGNIFIPDARVGWNYFALRKARYILTHEKIELVITTGPPHSSHLIGSAVKKEREVLIYT